MTFEYPHEEELNDEGGISLKHDLSIESKSTQPTLTASTSKGCFAVSPKNVIPMTKAKKIERSLRMKEASRVLTSSLNKNERQEAENLRVEKDTKNAAKRSKQDAKKRMKT